MIATLSGLWTRHGAHLLLIVGPMLFFAFVAVRADLRERRARRNPPQERRRVGAAALLPVVLLPGLALAAHLTICPSHPVGNNAASHGTTQSDCGHCCSGGGCL